MRLSPVLALTTGVVLAWPSAAQAGSRPYAFTQGVESLPETGIELESWVSEEKPRGQDANFDWWLGPVVGITDRLEAGLFVIFVEPADTPAQTTATGTIPAESYGLGLASLRLQMSYALAERRAWPVDVRIRGEIGAPLARNWGGSPAEGLDNEKTTTWLTAIIARDFGPLNLTLNAGGWLEFEKGEAASGEQGELEVEPYTRAAFGASVELLRGFRLGGELFGESTEKFGGVRVLAGPALAYGYGRFWLAIAAGFGLSSDAPRHRGRLVLGIVL